MDDNPYVVVSNPILPDDPPACSGALHSVWSVTIATILGSAVAGSIAIGLSLARLGRQRSAWVTISVTTAVVILISIALYCTPDDFNVPAAAIVVPQVICMRQLAKHLYGRELSQQQQADGPIAGGWVGAGLGMIVCCSLCAVLIGGALVYEGVPVLSLLDDYGTEVAFGEDVVYVDAGATPEDADQLASFLQEWEYFENDETTARIRRVDGEYVISFALVDGAWDEPPVIAYYQLLTGELLAAGFGPPLQVELCDGRYEPKRVLKGSPQSDL